MPVCSIYDETGQIYIWDGYHRGEAAKIAGIQLRVNLKLGTRLDAEWLVAMATTNGHNRLVPE